MMNKRGLDRYQKLLIEWISTAIKPGNPADLSSYSDTEYELIDSVFRRFTELTEAVDRLDLCMKFIKAPMPRQKKLQADEYLMYHITFYIQEVYILNERFEAYAKNVTRIRKKQIGSQGIDDAALTALLDRIRSALSPIVQARGSHVHARAFTDEKMRELSMYSFLRFHDLGRSEWHVIAKDLYRETRETWVEKFKRNRIAITQLLDEYCDYMYEVVTSEPTSLLPVNRHTNSNSDTIM